VTLFVVLCEATYVMPSHIHSDHLCIPWRKPPQMLGRGLRRAPGKDSCLVLDFTDKQHKVDRIIDLRVLLPEDAFKALDRDWEPPEQKDKARKLKLDELRGGEISVLADDVDPYDMAFVSNVMYVTRYACRQGVRIMLACLLLVASTVLLLAALVLLGCGHRSGP
jgi:hypothetical protein